MTQYPHSQCMFLYDLPNSQLLYLWTLTGGKKKMIQKKYQLRKLTNMQQKIMEACSGFAKINNRK